MAMSKEGTDLQYIGGVEAQTVILHRETTFEDHSEYWRISTSYEPTIHWRVKDRSIGWICSPLWKGTGFRAGDDFIITASHVLQKIIAEMGGVEKIFRNERIYIQFDHKVRYQFLKIVYDNPYDPTMDFAVVQLYNPSNDARPKPLRLLRQDLDMPQLTFVAFNEEGTKDVDDNCQTNIENIKDQVQKCSEQLKKIYPFQDSPYEGLTDERLMPLQTKLRHGASGAPGIVTQNGQDMVCVVLTKGYPRFFWSLSPEDQSKIGPFEIQAAIRISAIYKQMMKSDDQDVIAVCKNIFSEQEQGFSELPNNIASTMTLDSGYSTGSIEENTSAGNADCSVSVVKNEQLCLELKVRKGMTIEDFEKLPTIQNLKTSDPDLRDGLRFSVHVRVPQDIRYRTTALQNTDMLTTDCILLVSPA